MTDTTTPPPQLYAIVELFGHARIAGAVTEQTFGGQSFVRVDVPEVTVPEGTVWRNGAHVSAERTIPAHTRSLGPGSIYAINWVDQPTALLAARSIRHEPLSMYSIRQAIADMPEQHRRELLAGPSDDDQPF